MQEISVIIWFSLNLSVFLHKQECRISLYGWFDAVCVLEIVIEVAGYGAHFVVTRSVFRRRFAFLRCIDDVCSWEWA